MRLEDTGLYVDRPALRRLSDHLLDQVMPRSPQMARICHRRRGEAGPGEVHRNGRLGDVDGHQSSTACVGMVDRPLQRGLGTRRAVDADDHDLPGNVALVHVMAAGHVVTLLEG